MKSSLAQTYNSLLPPVLLLHPDNMTQSTRANSRSHTSLSCYVPLPAGAAAHIKLIPSTEFYTHFKFAHNKWNENESFYTWLRWKRWHINEEKTLLRVSERDISSKRHGGGGGESLAFTSSSSCWHFNKEKIWLGLMEVEGNTSRSPPAFQICHPKSRKTCKF